MSWASWDTGGGGGTATKSAPRQRRGVFGFNTGSNNTSLFGRPPQTPIVLHTDPANSSQNPHSRPPGSYAAPTGQFGVGSWYDTPGIKFNENGQAWNPATGVYQTVQLPGWAGSDPAAFYGAYQSAPEAYRPAMIANMQSTYEANNQQEEALGRGRQALTGQMGAVNDAANNWANDPNRALVMEEMARRASPDYQFFTPQQRTAYEDPIRQGYAAADINQRAAAAGHGTSQGGGAIGSNQALAVQAQTGGNQLRAQIDESEQKLKNEALSALAGTTSAYNAADSMYVNAGNQLAGALASLESGAEYQPTDYTVWPALNDATKRAEDEAAFRDRALTDMEQQSKFGFDDLTEFLLSSMGSGLWDFVF